MKVAQKSGGWRKTTAWAKFCFSRPCELAQDTQDNLGSNFHMFVNTELKGNRPANGLLGEVTVLLAVLNSKTPASFCRPTLRSLTGLAGFEGSKPPSDIPYQKLPCPR